MKKITAFDFLLYFLGTHQHIQQNIKYAKIHDW